jgi:hypothetical protein
MNIKTSKASRGNQKRKPKDTQYNGKNIKTRKAGKGNQKPSTEEHTIQWQEHKDKKSLKGLPEAVNRRTHNTMART